MVEQRPTALLRATDALLDRLPRGAHRLAFIWVFVGGLLTIAVCRAIFFVHHPEWFVDTVPTASKTAALAPSAIVFTFGMDTVGLCILAVWIFHGAVNQAEIRARGRGSEAANRLTVFLGLCQGISVILMATIDMEMQEFLHILFSITTFVFGALAYLADVFGASLWRVGVAETVSYRLRRMLAVSVTPIGLFFLYLFLEKANGPIVDPDVTQVVYVSTEHVLAFLSFAYAPVLALDAHAFLDRRQTHATGRRA